MTKAQQSEENNFYIGNAFSQTLRLLGKFLRNLIVTGKQIGRAHV